MEATRRTVVAVAGAGDADDELAALARELGAALARGGAVVATGGRGGVMAAASAGARAAGGLVVGILPGVDATETPPNPGVELALFTGAGQLRNQVLVLSAAVVVAVGGGWGTLSEVAIALKHRVPVILLRSWSLRRPDGAGEPLLHEAATAAEAAAVALRLAGLQ